MTCGDLNMEERIIPFLQNQLDDDELEACITHIEHCPQCYEELQISFSLFYGLKMLDEEEPRPVHLQRELERMIEGAKERIRRRRRLKRLSGFVVWAIIAVLAAAACFFLFGRSL